MKSKEPNCSRCGSPRKVTKTWVEMVKTFDGQTKLTFSQTICTNKECQFQFEKEREEFLQKKEEMRLKKEALLAIKTNGVVPQNTVKKALRLK